MSDFTASDHWKVADPVRTQHSDLQNCIDEKHDPDGYNIGMNCGRAAGQTVMHFHCHVIPRYEGDMENPRGGIRRRSYLAKGVTDAWSDEVFDVAISLEPI